MKISVFDVIDAPRPEVFAAALDVLSWSDAISAIESVEVLTPGSIGVGTIIRETRKMCGQSASEDMTFAEIVPHERFVLTAHNHGTAYRTEHIFKDADGGTMATVHFEGTPVTWLAWMLMPIGLLMAGSLRKMIARDLLDLKAVVERSAC